LILLNSRRFKIRRLFSISYKSRIVNVIKSSHGETGMSTTDATGKPLAVCAKVTRFTRFEGKTQPAEKKTSVVGHGSMPPEQLAVGFRGTQTT
jgi:hypothetical protein